MRPPCVALVAAMDRNRVIGVDNELPWRLPNDLKRFKMLTLGHPILMGRKTRESIGRPLPGRRNLVLSRQTDLVLEGAEVAPSPEGALNAVRDATWLYVIGGEKVFETFLPIAQRLYLTLVDAEVGKGDAYFPAWNPADFTEIARDTFPADERHAHAYAFVDYAKVG